MNQGQEVLVLSINFILYLWLAIHYIRKNGLCFNTFPLVIWAASSLCSIFYFLSPFRLILHSYENEVTLFPLIYLFALVWISFLPLLRFKKNIIHTIKVNNSLYVIICILLILVSAFTFIPNFSYFAKNVTSLDFFIDQKEELSEGGGVKIFSGFTEKCMILVNYMRGVIPILFVLSFTRIVNKNFIIRLGLSLVMINLLVLNLNKAARFSLLTDLLYLAFLYALLGDFFSKHIRKAMKYFAVFVSSILISLIALISIARFGDDSGYTASMDFMITRYAGESFPNFSADLWDLPKTADGENCFGYFIYKAEGKKQVGRDRHRLAQITKRRMHVFYSFIGDYYTDFGRYITPIFVILLSYIFICLTKANRIISISKIILLSIYSKVLLLGTTYWTYVNFSYELLGSTFVIILFGCFNLMKAHSYTHE